jgi:hypothetical protein
VRSVCRLSLHGRTLRRETCGRHGPP